MKYRVLGTFLDTINKDNFRIQKGTLIIDNGIIKEFNEDFNYQNDLLTYDYRNYLLIPGFTDLHLHAPQYSYTGCHMDKELLDWLATYTFPEEAKYQDLEYANIAYDNFIRDLKNSVTTRASIFSSIHTDSTLLLMDKLEKEKMIAYVGKVGMDRNSPDYYIESNGEEETIRFIKEAINKNYQYVYPIITPRFTPSVSDNYMISLANIANTYNLPVQSHLSENNKEIEFVKELRPNDLTYLESYIKPGLVNKARKTIMAHCIHCSDYEKALIKENNIYIAHSPTSNVNTLAGICPAKEFLSNNFNIALASDVAGGNTLDMFDVLKCAIVSSKVSTKYLNTNYSPLTLSEAFYMGTVIGGSFFGNVGKFSEGYEFDCVILNDNMNQSTCEFSYEERLERMIYLNKKEIIGKFIKGNKIK